MFKAGLAFYVILLQITCPLHQNEKWTPPADHHNTTGEFNPAVHSFHGMTGVSLAGFPQAINERAIQVTKELPEEFPFNLDMNSGRMIGLGR